MIVKTDLIRPIDGLFIGTPFENEATAIADFRDGSKMKSDLAIRWNENSNIGYVLARRVLELFNDATLTIAFDEYGVCSSYENRYLTRALYNFYLGLNEVDFHVGVDFTLAARDAAVSFLHLGIEQGWGGVLFSRSRREWFSFNHDAFGWMKTDRKTDWPTENKLPWLNVTAIA